MYFRKLSLSPGSVHPGSHVPCLMFPAVSDLPLHSFKKERASSVVNSWESSGLYLDWVNLIPFLILEPVTVARLLAFVLISVSQSHVIIPSMWGRVRCIPFMSTDRGVRAGSHRNTGFCNKKGDEEVFGRQK